MENTMLINLLVNKVKENPTRGCREGRGKKLHMYPWNRVYFMFNFQYLKYIQCSMIQIYLFMYEYNFEIVW